MTDTGFMLDSKEEIEKKSGSFSPLEADDYIIKLAKVDLVQKPTYKNGGWDYSNLVWMFECIVMVSGLKAGGVMVDSEGETIVPYTRYLRRDVNPKSTGFMPDQVTPSFLRGIIAYMEGTKLNDRLKAPDFVLLSRDNKVVEDAETRKEFLEKVTNGEAMEGFRGIPDIRKYEGRFIGCALEVKDKYNKISKFSKLPSAFKPEEISPEDQEKFNKYYTEKVLTKREEFAAAGSTSVKDTNTEDLGEVVLEEISL